MNIQDLQVNTKRWTKNFHLFWNEIFTEKYTENHKFLKEFNICMCENHYIMIL